MSDLTVDSTAREMVAAIASREISCAELMDLHLERIAERNPRLNAIVSLDEERARDGATEADRTPYGERGPLHGLPWAFKDTHAVAGWLTTYGSPLFADNVPDRDELLVERIRRAGAVPIGRPTCRSSRPAATRSTRSSAPPSTRSTRRGGGRVERRSGVRARGRMVPLADGSDMGGSLRNPASFCGVVGLRPSLGRVPAWPTTNHWEALGSAGRWPATSATSPCSVGDRRARPARTSRARRPGPTSRRPSWAASPACGSPSPRIWAACSRWTPRWPPSSRLPDGHVGGRRPRRGRPTRPEPGRGHLPHPAGLDLPGPLRRPARRAPRRLQAVAGRQHPRRRVAHRRRRRPRLRQRTALGETARRSSSGTTCSCCRSRQVPPFPADQEYPADINGKPMATYLDWMRSAYFVTVTGCPAISVPGGTTRDGLPVGVQLVAPHGADRRLLEIAAAFEALGIGLVTPQARPGSVEEPRRACGRHAEGCGGTRIP